LTSPIISSRRFKTPITSAGPSVERQVKETEVVAASSRKRARFGRSLTSFQ
jgi:uncharacterized protein (DUF3084 family)